MREDLTMGALFERVKYADADGAAVDSIWYEDSDDRKQGLYQQFFPNGQVEFVCTYKNRL